MKALVTKQYGSEPVYEIQERPEPKRIPGYALVRIRAAAVTPLMRNIGLGKIEHAKSPPLIQGNEASGEVVASDRWKPGARVLLYARWENQNFGVNTDGFYAEYVSVPDEFLLPQPEGFSFEEGGAFTTNFLTAYFALTHHGQAREGETVLISGATGNVGFAAVQIAKALGLNPVGIVSSTAKAAHLQQRIDVPVVDLSRHDILDEVRALTKNRGPSLAVDSVGGELCGKMVQAMTKRGRLVAVGYTGGYTVPLAIRDLIIGQKSILGYEPSDFSTAQRLSALRKVVAWGEQGKVRPCIDSIYTLGQWDDAFQRLTSRDAVGSVVFSI